MGKILVTGSNGQLGSELKELVTQYPEYQFVFTDLPELDICDPDSLEAFFSGKSFTHIINCAAYTAVDKAESDPENAYKVNALGPANLAAIAAKNNIKLVHTSTDYVFHGDKNAALNEDEKTDPISVYGKTKLAGEQVVFASGADAVIIRTSWLYSSYGANFVKTILRLASERDELKIVADQHGNPTYAADLADVIMKLIIKGIEPGVQYYHYSNQGETIWYEFAREIVNYTGKSCKVLPITTDEYPVAAKRPAYSIMSKEKIINHLGIAIPFWKDSLHRCLDKMMM